MKVAVFPGQGAQFSGMGKDLYDRYPKAKEMFHEANEILGFSITDIMFSGTEEALKMTKVTQPAVFLHSIIAYQLLTDDELPAMTAGHSLGEFTALEANKVLIAYTDKYTSSRQWNKYSTQKSAVIYLVQGNTYYIEALHKEGTVNDNMAVGWLKPGQTGTSPSQVIPGSVLSPRTPLKIATIESRSALIPVLDVYPNPARNEILFNLPENLLGEKVVVSIMSMNGQVILNKELTFSGPEQTDIRSCVPGLYILRVQNKDFSINKSFVVYR